MYKQSKTIGPSISKVPSHLNKGCGHSFKYLQCFKKHTEGEKKYIELKLYKVLHLNSLNKFSINTRVSDWIWTTEIRAFYITP